MSVENKDSCSQRDSAEREGVRAHRSFRRIWKERDSAQPELLEEILEKDNLNRAFKRVKANKGAPGIDGITVEETGAYLRENFLRQGGDGVKLNQAVSERLTQLLNEKGMTQYQLYMKSGVPKSTIGNVINCSYDSVKLRVIHEMCQGLGIGLDAFFASPLFDENNLEP